MVHALRQIHRSLTPDGVLLDVHPQPTNSRIEVWQDRRVHDLGEVDQEEENREIEDARGRLELVVKEGLFTPETSDYFEAGEHHDSVSSWQEHWAEEEYQLIAPAGMLESAERLLSSGGGELVIRESVRATRLRRLES